MYTRPVTGSVPVYRSFYFHLLQSTTEYADGGIIAEGNRFMLIISVLRKAGPKAKPGVDKPRFHDLRHTAATNLARVGNDIKFIAQYLGHTDVKRSARYIHCSDEDLKKGAEALARVPSDFTTPNVASS
jgi:integrase